MLHAEWNEHQEEPADAPDSHERLGRWPVTVFGDSPTWPAAARWARLCERMGRWPGIAPSPCVPGQQTAFRAKGPFVPIAWAKAISVGPGIMANTTLRANGPAIRISIDGDGINANGWAVGPSRCFGNRELGPPLRCGPSYANAWAVGPESHRDRAFQGNGLRFGPTAHPFQ